MKICKINEHGGFSRSQSHSYIILFACKIIFLSEMHILFMYQATIDIYKPGKFLTENYKKLTGT